MAASPARRPLPALVALVALLLLTALVWWRVLHRGSTGTAASTCPTTAPHTSLPAPAQVTVQVLNATKRNGIASRARTTLVADGFNIPTPASNDRPKLRIRGVGEIRFSAKAARGAQLLHYYLPAAHLVRLAGNSAVVIVSLGDKYRGLSSASAVQETLRRRQIELTSAAPAPSSSPSC